MRAFRLPPAVRETGMRNAEGLSAKLTEGVTTPSGRHLPRRGRSSVRCAATLALSVQCTPSFVNAQQGAPSSRACSLPPAVRETGMRNAEGLSAKLTEGVTTPSVCLPADTSLKEGGLLSDARQCALSPFNALFLLKCATRSSLLEGISLAARCAGNRQAKCRRSGARQRD